MIVMQPVLEVRPSDGFTLWPVDGSAPYGFLALDGALGPAGIGTAVMSVAAHNDVDPGEDRPSRPDEPLDGFLHGLLTMDELFAAGGLRVTDTVSGTTLVPGCWADSTGRRNTSITKVCDGTRTEADT
ncbi:hypothetical protein KIK06_15525 [Nocardiopsis sp. EMB25]|uniref:hypothetical protein n=1 Tax=Nocardiopsis sp. EMB25 TaxID=2835867 RepID=UPI00228344C5|nr:hypothetical protein [Nocardiopsis sp. EMB25]MCY9785293.1 hypothetical protein [Nocardiopsis sp. EMB25]